MEIYIIFGSKARGSRVEIHRCGENVSGSDPCSTEMARLLVSWVQFRFGDELYRAEVFDVLT